MDPQGWEGRAALRTHHLLAVRMPCGDRRRLTYYPTNFWSQPRGSDVWFPTWSAQIVPNNTNPYTNQHQHKIDRRKIGHNKAKQINIKANIGTK
jgi:hypothetical protein